MYFGDPKAFLTRVDQYTKVTPQDVQRVVNTYFQKRNRTVSVLVPSSGGGEAAAATPAKRVAASEGGQP